MSDSNNLGEDPYKPDVRSYTNRKLVLGQKKKPDPAFNAGDRVRMTNPSTGIKDWIMVIDKRYDFNEERWGWDYAVKDSNGIPYDGKVAETNLEDA